VPDKRRRKGLRKNSEPGKKPLVPEKLQISKSFKEHAPKEKLRYLRKT
jgi:hypothetical protein